MAIRPCFRDLRGLASRAEMHRDIAVRRLLDEGALVTLPKADFCGNMRQV
jgi:hypothetical protein